MWIDKDGNPHQAGRKWYTARETREIYGNGGHVVLIVKEATPREKALAARDQAKNA